MLIGQKANDGERSHCQRPGRPKGSWQDRKEAGGSGRSDPQRSRREFSKDAGRKLSLGDAALLKKLGIPQRTMTRRLSERSRLTPAESDRAVRFARIFAHAVAMIGEEEKAVQWLLTCSRALGGERPLDRRDTDVGAREVEDVAGRIAYGVHS